MFFLINIVERKLCDKSYYFNFFFGDFYIYMFLCRKMWLKKSSVIMIFEFLVSVYGGIRCGGVAGDSC